MPVSTGVRGRSAGGSSPSQSSGTTATSHTGAGGPTLSGLRTKSSPEFIVVMADVSVRP